MWNHLKDNSGLHPVWPALIIALIVVLIFFVGLLALYTDHPIIGDIMSWWNGILSWVQSLFNGGPYQPLG